MGGHLGASESKPLAPAFTDDGLFSAMAEAHQAAVGATANPAVPGLRAHLRSGEDLRMFFQVLSYSGEDMGRARDVVMVETDQRLVVIDAYGHLLEHHPIGAVRIDEWGQGVMGSTKATLRVSGKVRKVAPTLPALPAEILHSRLTGAEVEPPAPGVPGLPACPPLAYYGELRLHEDRLVTVNPQTNEVHQVALTGEESATVDTAGNIAVTRGRNLAAKGWGTAATMAAGLGPLGAFILGNAKESQIDTREVFLLIEGPTWAYSSVAPGDWGIAARNFAQLVGVAARRLQPPEAIPESAEQDPLTRLKLLGELRDSGVLTEEEFTEQKARILGQS